MVISCSGGATRSPVTDLNSVYYVQEFLAAKLVLLWHFFANVRTVILAYNSTDGNR